MALFVGQISITTDHYIIEGIGPNGSDKTLFQIHRNALCNPQYALDTFIAFVKAAIIENDQSMNKTCDWSQPIPHTDQREKIEQLLKERKEIKEQ